MKQVTLFLFCVLALSSCVTYKTPGDAKPVRLTSATALDGTYFTRTVIARGEDIPNKTYWDNYINLTRLLNIADHTEFVTIKAISPEQLKISYYVQGQLRETILKGKMKKKYFEVYFSKKQLIIPFIYGRSDVDQVRLSKTEKGELYVYKAIDRGGFVLIFGGGGFHKHQYAYPDSLALNGLRPSINSDGLWGYKYQTGTFIITPEYDYASVFEGDVARVKKDNKWSIIDRQGIPVTDVKYDCLMPFDTIYSPAISRVSIGDKYGAINMKGQEVIPVVYDELDNYFTYGMARVRSGDKWGIVTREGIIAPAIYDNILLQEIYFRWDDKKRDHITGAWGTRNGARYLITSDGYEYETVKMNEGLLIKDMHTFVVRDSKKKITSF